MTVVKNQQKWDTLNPVSTAPVNNKELVFNPTKHFLSDPGIMRRDPSDIIHSCNKYYVWYTKVDSTKPGYPGGWCGTVWYATSKDGYEWKEEGLAIDRGAGDDWDGSGVYSPNILIYGSKYYLAYTAVPAPFNRETSQSSIGLAVSDSPDGPWVKLENNPVITPGNSTEAPDGFLCDDSVFVLHDKKIWLYYKGRPKMEQCEGIPARVPKNAFLLVAKADKPEGPYVKNPKVLHRGHEAVVWKDTYFIGSLCMAWGPRLFFTSRDGINFKAMNPLNPLKAAGIYRQDLVKRGIGARPTWGIAMGNNQGLCRFDFLWPQDSNNA